MDKETILRYAPFIVVVISIALQWNLFVTPEKLEIKHREILEDVAAKYSTKEQYSVLKTQLNDMQIKIDKIYDRIMAKWHTNSQNAV